MPHDPKTNRTFYLPRLDRKAYQRDAVVHWTLPTTQRETGWLSPEFHAEFRETMLHAASREGLACPIYVLMPDHIHLVWMGLREDTDQLNGMAFLRTHLEGDGHLVRFQHQSHDHVLNSDERKKNAFAAACFYVLMNPVRASLTATPSEWKFLGCVVPGYPRVHPCDVDFWPTFWKIYQKLRMVPGR